MRKYQAILFDLFDTLVDLKVERLPLVQIGGKERPSTAEVIYQAVQEYYAHVGPEEFFQALMDTSLRIDRLMDESHREILAQERFRLVLEHVGIASPPAAVVERLVTVHMDQMFQAMEFPPARRRVLEILKPAYRLGIVSNFDHPPTVYRLLRHYQLDPFFDTVMISGVVGWRKPRKEIFCQALNALGILPQQALFVGDTPSADIVGSKRAGMDVVWLNHSEGRLDFALPQPDYIIQELEQLPSILTAE